METGISRLLLGAIATLLLCAACGGGTKSPSPGTAPQPSSTTNSAGSTPSQRAFSWLVPKPAPPGWQSAQIPSGAELFYPASWQRQDGDPGTATAALLTSKGTFLGYLNITPQQGPEKLTGWAAFRIHHDEDEGDQHLKQLASATGLRFRTGPGSCVEDSYSTEIHKHYLEIACIVAGKKATTVIVGAAPPSAWSREAPVIRRAIEGLET
jgi:hypothetical protein